MRTRLFIALGSIAGFGMGAISVQALNVKAESKPPVYLISEIDAKDEKFFQKEVRADSKSGTGGLAWAASMS